MIYSILTALEAFIASASNYDMKVEGELTFALIALVGILSLKAVCFIFKGFGLYYIAKKEGISKPYFAFIPFVSYYLLGKIVGKVKVFGYHVKNLGLITMILMLVSSATSFLFDFLMYKDNIIALIETGHIGILPDNYGSVWVDVVLSMINAVSNILLIIAEVFLIMTFFMYYGKKNQLAFSLLSIFFEPLFGILVFVVRKEKRFDYSQYMKMRFDSYNANRSGGGFNNPQSPFTREEKSPFENYESQNPYKEYENQRKNQADDIDVFEDYSDKK